MIYIVYKLSELKDSEQINLHEGTEIEPETALNEDVQSHEPTQTQTRLIQSDDEDDVYAEVEVIKRPTNEIQ